ncbi:hypothetical protein H2199_009189 [Coniosporium tulheliwenetii]|uniref:Uncharacterized protein n=1 Tax=Coniosporium tulheliwenetii TaxID=3383036 RepID=A0ACC2YFG1_9PEZI|nr:hypothetical protein H2199_009189 [Cladosporium sp. JES 115]
MLRKLMRLGTEGSSTDDFRSVIDDLTIENKKLKRKLKKYEKLYDAHLQDEKLFEIRVHKLPPHKKRELEETLKKFAMGLEESPESEPAGIGFDRLAPRLEPHLTTSSYTSTRFADSAYASASISGQNSSAPSGHDSNYRKIIKSELSRQKQSIQSYLHDIPAGLLPKPAVAMTETAKKKLVVRRLEQIFAGKGPGSGDHQQPIQQQEVAQSAARADRRAMEASGQRAREEGVREARIMPKEAADDDSEHGPIGAIQNINTTAKISEQDFADQKSPDQRPTRPLDLDPQRAQVPEDNLQYIRRLGFSPMDLDVKNEQEDGHGWIYLNLLINMAQLHTINLAPEFVRSAVTDHSSKFELSQDGRKIRWKGGRDYTRMSSDSSSSGRNGGSSPDENSILHGVGSKRRKLDHNGSESASRFPSKQRTLARQLAREKDKFAYTPLFFHKEETDDGHLVSEPEASDMESPPLAPIGGNSSGFASSGMRTASSRKRRDDGPIIFYNKAKFCTDHSGARKLHPNASHSPVYTSVTPHPLGSEPNLAHAGLLDLAEPRGPLEHAKSLHDQMGKMDLDDDSVSDVDLNIHSTTSAKPTSSARAPSPKPAFPDFQVSGVGGVYPADHFSIAVQSVRLRVQGRSLPASKVPKKYPRKIQSVLDERHKDHYISHPAAHDSKAVPGPLLKTQVISARFKSLPPSALPPPIHFNPSSTDDTDDEEDEGTGSDSDLSSTASDHPAAAPQPFNLDSFPLEETSSDSSGDDDENEDDGSDDSVDLLATACEIDPATIRAREREYDANMAERLAEEIPAGSRAATAGGGVGLIVRGVGMGRARVWRGR